MSCIVLLTMQSLGVTGFLLCLGGIAVGKRERATQVSIASNGNLDLDRNAQVTDGRDVTSEALKTRRINSASAKAGNEIFTILMKLATAAYQQIGRKQVWIINMDMDTYNRRERWITYHKGADIDSSCKDCKYHELPAVRGFGLTRQHYFKKSSFFSPSLEAYKNALPYGASQKITVTSEGPTRLQVVKGWHDRDPELMALLLETGSRPPAAEPVLACKETKEFTTGGVHVYVGGGDGCLIHDISTVLNMSGEPDTAAYEHAQKILKLLICTRSTATTSDIERDPDDDTCMNYLSCAISELFWRSSTKMLGFSYHGDTYRYEAWNRDSNAICLQSGDRKGLWHYGEFCGEICPAAGPCHEWCGRGGACCSWNINLAKKYHAACGPRGGAPKSCPVKKCCVPDRTQDGWETQQPKSGLNDELARSFGEACSPEGGNCDEVFFSVVSAEEAED